MKIIIFYLLAIIAFCPINVSSQVIAPFTINNGGGSSISMEWSIGESVSIANFIVLGYSLNTGVLQPLTNIGTFINEDYLPLFGTEIIISPNPTANLLNLKTIFSEEGSLSILLIDSKSTLVFKQEVAKIIGKYDKDIFMEKYPSGIYFIIIFFKPSNGKGKVGTYKIIKL
jgi:hypothetical protein